MAGELVKLYLPLPIAPHRWHYRLNHRSHYRVKHPPTPTRVCGKNCLPGNRSLVPKRLGTADLRGLFKHLPEFLIQVGLRWSPGICISNKFLNAAGGGASLTTLRDPLL